MLIRFWVEGYRGFGHQTVLDFSDKKNYKFGNDCIRGDYLDKIIILGENGSGKTNLGYAMSDIVTTVIGLGKDLGQMSESCFLNADSDCREARFHYEFLSHGKHVTYEYAKSSARQLISEHLVLGKDTVFGYRLGDEKSYVFDETVLGIKKVDFSELDGSVSLMRRLNHLTTRDPASPVRIVCDFASNTLYYRAMWFKDEHIGITDHDNDFEKFIIENGLLADLKSFLSEVGVSGTDIRIRGESLVIHAANRDLPFLEAASRGTTILCRLYTWIMRTRGCEALLFYDDFDDMFHYKPAETAMRKILAETRAQCVFVTHNTGLVSNEFLRPDCVFIMEDGELRSLASSTDKDIRYGHNLEKMLRGGEFDRTSKD